MNYKDKARQDIALAKEHGSIVINFKGTQACLHHDNEFNTFTVTCMPLDLEKKFGPERIANYLMSNYSK